MMSNVHPGWPLAYPMAYHGMWDPSMMYVEQQFVQAGQYAYEMNFGFGAPAKTRCQRGGKRHTKAKKNARQADEVLLSEDEAQGPHEAIQKEQIQIEGRRLIERLRNGDNEKEVVDEFRELAFDSQHNSFVAQCALDIGSNDENAKLAGGLRGRVVDACKDPYANHVIQKVLEKLPPADFADLVLEVNDYGVELAKHKFGCRFICRLLEHEPDQKELFDKITAEAGELCRHTFGNYCMEHILEHGLPTQRKEVVAALCVDTFEHAKHRNGSRIVEKALEKDVCSVADQDALCDALVDNPDHLQDLAKHRFGCYVVKRLLSMPEENSGPAVNILRLAPEPTKFQQVVLDELNKI